MRECLSLVDKGVISAEELDTCVQWGIGFKLAVIPPLQLLDVAGLDIYKAVASYLNADLDDSSGVSGTVTSLVDHGDLGMKTGKGLFEYTPECAAELRKGRAAKLVVAAGPSRRSEANLASEGYTVRKLARSSTRRAQRQASSTTHHCER